MSRAINIVLLVIVGAVVISVANGQRKPAPAPSSKSVEDSECPEPDGFFADIEQCDKYYHCVDGKMTEKLCPDGLVFNDEDSGDLERCDLPFHVNCDQRPELQEPKPSLHCPRKNGYFPHEEENVCGKFYYCVDGKANTITCPHGLVYDETKGICSWPDDAKKAGCSSSDVFQFDCPKVNESYAMTHPRFADPDDCQYFYVCVNGETPRRSGCKLGQVFDDVEKRCEWSRLVPDCADWYKDRLTDEELEKLENPPKLKPRGMKVSKRKPKMLAKPVRNDDDDN